MRKTRRRRYRRMLTARLTPALWSDLDARLSKTGQTRSGYVRTLIADDLARS